MIQYINLLTRDGKSLLFRNYGASDVDCDMFSGFLSAFMGIMKEVSQSDIKSTITEQSKYFYTLIDEVVIVVCTDLDEDDSTINSKITTIRAQFFEKYGKIISQVKWSGNRAMFTGFERVIDDTMLGPIKVSIIGEAGVGKTTLVHLICREDIDLEYVPTINADIINYDGEELGIHRSIVFWDLAGQKPYDSLWKSLLDGTNIALLVLDSTFENLIRAKEILRNILDKFYKNVIVIGIANNQNLPNRLTPEFCEKILSEVERYPPIKVYGIDADNPLDRKKILAILRDAIIKIYGTKEEKQKQEE